nr:hypothetical protein [Tanacetum cinerariifolium]
MREGENDMCVWGQGHMGRSGEVLGTVQVRCGCTGMAGEEVVDFGEKDEFVGELTLLKSIPSGIDETDSDFEEDIRLIEKLLYDNSSPRPPKEFVSANFDAESESFSPSPILVKEYQEKDKIGSKPNKNGKRGEAGKSQKRLQWIKQEKLKKTQKVGPEMQSLPKFIKERIDKG